MTRTTKTAALFLLITNLFIGTSFAFAASTTASSTYSSHNGNPYGNGGSYYNQGTSAAISQLSPDAVQNISIPILFGVTLSEISPNFGDPRAGGPHQGEDILAATDTPIVSPTQAVVLSVGVYPGGGNYVSTENPGGENFVYMHLDKPSVLTAGTVLQVGDLIGYVGSTGDAVGGPSHLHFEIRKNGVATNPFLRITQEFSLAQKMTFFANILAKSSDRASIISFMVGMYPGDFVSAQTQGISLPPDVTAELQRISSGGLGIYTSRDISPGMKGPSVVALQDFLIIQNKGPAARALGSAGATGNFGSITKNALIEYQTSIGIVPANGYYAATTRAYVQNASASPVVIATTTPIGVSTTISIAIPNRDLTIGARGTDVIWLQDLLIGANSGPAALALVTAGATGYFGAVTRAALIEYQVKAKISPAVGYFGPLTRAYIAAVH